MTSRLNAARLSSVGDGAEEPFAAGSPVPPTAAGAVAAAHVATPVLRQRCR
jgi:hypothetical protein